MGEGLYQKLYHIVVHLYQRKLILGSMYRGGEAASKTGGIGPLLCDGGG